MVTINKSEILDSFVKKARIDTAREAPPSQLSNIVTPVLVGNETGVTRLIVNSALNTNTKSIAVPKGAKWKVWFGNCKYIADATVGSRRVRISIADKNNNELWVAEAANTQTASSTESYGFQPGISQSTELTAGFHYMPIPTWLVLTEECTITVFDVGTVSSGDDFTLAFVVDEMSMEA